MRLVYGVSGNVSLAHTAGGRTASTLCMSKPAGIMLSFLVQSEKHNLETT